MRIRLISLCAVGLAIAIVFAAPAAAKDARSIMEIMQTRQVERLQGVETYVVDQSMMGNRAPLYFQRVTVKDTQGKSHEVVRPTLDFTTMCGVNEQNFIAALSPDELDQIADAYEMTGDAVAAEVEAGLAEAGLPPGLLAATGSDPWATLDPRVMMGGQADFYRFLAEGKREQAAEAAKPDDSVHDLAVFARSARVVGTETVDGRQAYHLRADGLNISQESDGGEFIIQELDMWVDAVEYVALRTKMGGIARSGKETRPITLERLDMDYRKVPESRMYESYRQVMRMEGLMDAQQQAEMQQAQQQLADFERQMDQLPPGQKDMILRQMGPQMEMLRSLASGGGAEFVTEVHEIVVNHCSLDEPYQPNIAFAGMSFTDSLKGMSSGGFPDNAAAPKSIDPGAAESARQACLQEKIARAEQAGKAKRGLGRLASAATRIAARTGDYDMIRVLGDVGTATATAGDLGAAARDLGITEQEIDACDKTG